MTLQTTRSIGLAAAIAAALVLSACGDGAPSPELVARGEQAFAVCAGCHTIAPGADNIVGPNLHGVYGQQAGSVAGFMYSPAMRSAGLRWNESNLDRYLTDPQSVVSGTSMIFEGIPDTEERAAIIAYLQSQK